MLTLFTNKLYVNLYVSTLYFKVDVEPNLMPPLCAKKNTHCNRSQMHFQILIDKMVF